MYLFVLSGYNYVFIYFTFIRFIVRERNIPWVRLNF